MPKHKEFNRSWNIIYGNPSFKFGIRYTAKQVPAYTQNQFDLTKWFDIYDFATKTYLYSENESVSERKEVHNNINRLVNSLNTDYSIYLYEIYKYVTPIVKQ